MVSAILRKGLPTRRPEAAEQYMQTIRKLRENPAIDHLVDDEGMRALTILRTPFIFMYRIGAEEIEIVRVRDGRGAE